MTTTVCRAISSCFQRSKAKTTKNFSSSRHNTSTAAGRPPIIAEKMMSSSSSTRAALAGVAGGGPSSSPSSPLHQPLGLSGSTWEQKELQYHFPSLTQSITTDICIVGGGIAGLTAAYLLSKQGKSVVLVEARVLGGGQTGRTTAHIMRWYDDYYYKVESMHGTEKMKQVADSYDKAIEFISNVVKEEGIECDFEHLDGYLFPHATGESSQPTSSSSALRKELDAALRAGVQGVKMTDLGGGAEVGGIREALLFPDCAEFNPLKYLNGLATAITDTYGGRIYEGTAVVTYGHNSLQVTQSIPTTPYNQQQAEGTTAKTITCREGIILATNSPINKDLLIHARQMPYRTYVIGMKIPRRKFKKAQYWDTAEPYHYIRTYPLNDGGKEEGQEEGKQYDVLIVGGEDHKTGSLQHYNPYQRLEDYARSRWTGAEEVLFKWNGQVMEPADMLHIAGLDPLSAHGATYVITGDSGQGMTGGTIGAMVISDLLTSAAAAGGKSKSKNEWKDLYSPSRLPAVKSLLEIGEEAATTTVSYIERVVPKLSLVHKELEREEGKIIQSGLHKVAIYKDAQDKVHKYSAVCTHLGCVVHFNRWEKSFDCSCHGSSFSCLDGSVIQGPATLALKPFEIEDLVKEE